MWEAAVHTWALADHMWAPVEVTDTVGRSHLGEEVHLHSVEEVRLGRSEEVRLAEEDVLDSRCERRSSLRLDHVAPF